MIPVSEWEWFGVSGHFICGLDCRFHLATLVGKYWISTVGEYLPDYQLREILAESRGIVLEGSGDHRLSDYLEKIGYEDVGFGRKYETMVFPLLTDARCDNEECCCGQPIDIDFSEELFVRGYLRRGEATLGHMETCRNFSGKG